TPSQRTISSICSRTVELVATARVIEAVRTLHPGPSFVGRGQIGPRHEVEHEDVHRLTPTSTPSQVSRTIVAPRDTRAVKSSHAAQQTGDPRGSAAAPDDPVTIPGKPPRTRARREVREWLASHQTTWPFAYESVYEALNFDPESVRRQLTAQSPTPRLPVAMPA